MPVSEKVPKVDDWQTVRDWREESAQMAQRNRNSYLSAYPRVIFFNDEQVVMSIEDWERMDDYSVSLPSGVYKDKVWRGNAEPYGEAPGLFMGIYREYDPPDLHHVETKFWHVTIVGVEECSVCEGHGWTGPGAPCGPCQQTGKLPAHTELGRKREPTWS